MKYRKLRIACSVACKTAFLLLAALCVRGISAQGLKYVIPRNQKAVLTFAPTAAEQSRPVQESSSFLRANKEVKTGTSSRGLGSASRLARRPRSRSAPNFAIRHGMARPLLDSIVADDSHGKYPRFMRLQVDSGDRDYAVNLYDINYRTWDVRCLWQGPRLWSFGVLGDSIFCNSEDGWLLVNTASGAINNKCAIHADCDRRSLLVGPKARRRCRVLELQPHQEAVRRPLWPC